MDRKSFLIKTGRIGILALFVFLIAGLERKEKISLSTSCTDGLVCGNCGKFKVCDREEAIKFRKNGSHEKY